METVYALGFSRWKRKPLQLCFPNCKLRFVRNSDAVPDGARLVVWGMYPVPDASQRGIAITRVEDGFLRSVGLGADLTRPFSWVVDGRGIYFDATVPSDLEILLSETYFTSDLIARAAALRKRIVTAGLTKYNVGTNPWRRPQSARWVILVPGQVESDASIVYGAPGIKTNFALLQAVRQANPDAYVLYKPHPDVVAGLRKGGMKESDAVEWCDELIIDVPMGDLLHKVDAVHCLTSLTGFEALLREKEVVCYGQPFYAGWGLTRDILPITRRKRRLSLDELIAGVLILYPRYLSWKRKKIVKPEQALDEMEERLRRNTNHLAWWRKAFRLVLRQIVGVR